MFNYRVGYSTTIGTNELQLYDVCVRSYLFIGRSDRTSWRAAQIVTMASNIPSGTSPPSAVVAASVYMWIPTFRTSMTLRPGRSSDPLPSARSYLVCSVLEEKRE